MMKDSIFLKGKRLIVRNFDWSKDFDAICRWNSNPEVLKYIEEDDIPSRTRDETKKLYEYFDQNGILLIAELEGFGAIGEAWLNHEKVPEEGAYRAPLMIGEPHLWGQGLGTDFLITILDYIFLALKHKTFYALDVNAANLNALKLYTRCSFITYQLIQKEVKNKLDSLYKLNMKINRERFLLIREYLNNLSY